MRVGTRVGRMQVWRDRSGRFSALKAATFLLCLAPGAGLALALATGRNPGRPITAALLATGIWSIRFLLASLAVTPLRTVFGWSRLMLVRRMLGVTAAVYALAHVGLYLAQQNFDWVFVARQIVEHLYLALGFVATVGFAVLAATSTDGAIRRLRGNWRRLHRAAYPVAAFSLVHFLLSGKINIGPAVLPTGLFLWLMLWRMLPEERRRGAGLLGMLGLGAGLLTAAVEAGWYGLATAIPPRLVFFANLTFAAGPRPAVWVAILGVGLAGAAFLQRHLARARR